MKYLKHKYSKRVYEVMTDHGPDNPYLSCFPFLRYCSKRTMETFFTPCSGPSDEKPLVNVEKELEWERAQVRKKAPIQVKAPDPTIKRSKKVKQRVDPPQGGYTLRDLCGEIGMDPARARKLLRSKGKTPPSGGWKWASKEEAKPIKRFLRKF